MVRLSEGQMTRARKIEAVIAEWLEREGWSACDQKTGISSRHHNLGGGWHSPDIDINVALLARMLDVELDRIIRETAA